MKHCDKDWSVAKKQFRQNWNALSADDLERTHGDKEALANLLEKRYGMPHPQAIASVSEIMNHTEVSPELPESEEQKKIEGDEKPDYPNKLYEEDLPPDLKMDE